MPKVALVDVKRLGQVVDLLVEELGTGQIEFMKARWLHQIQYWDQRSRGARWKYFALRGVVVLGGVSIPVLAAAQASLVIAGIISAAVAAAAAWEGVANYGQIWLEKRRAAELLKVEGWLFLQRADKYAGLTYQIAFPTFATEVERQIAKEVGEYVAGFDVEAATNRVTQTFKMLDAARVDR
jgi:Flp pilus assembly protein TadB